MIPYYEDLIGNVVMCNDSVDDDDNENNLYDYDGICYEQGRASPSSSSVDDNTSYLSYPFNTDQFFMTDVDDTSREAFSRTENEIDKYDAYTTAFDGTREDKHSVDNITSQIDEGLIQRVSRIRKMLGDKSQASDQTFTNVCKDVFMPYLIDLQLPLRPRSDDVLLGDFLDHIFPDPKPQPAVSLLDGKPIKRKNRKRFLIYKKSNGKDKMKKTASKPPQKRNRGKASKAKDVRYHIFLFFHFFHFK